MDDINEEQKRRLEEFLESNPNDSSLHFQLGLCLWETHQEKEKEKAAEHWVISAKLNPNNAAAFKHLGHYYATVSVDVQRATKCYQRALSLSPHDSDAGEALCDLLDRQGKETLALAICKDASHNSPRAFWAFRRLGFLQVHQKKWSEAVQSLQHAIRGYPTSPDLWEALGLAYHRLGMFTAAIKSYGRAIELEDTRVFALVECGNIFLMLGSFRKGVEQFQQVLKISPKNLSALCGLASGLLGLSKECINAGAYGWGTSLLEDACKVAEASIQSAGNSSCIWKLHGDIQLTYAQSYPWMESQHLEYNAETFEESIYLWKNTCRLAAISARNSYQRALHLAPWQANVYIDIAISSDLISSFHKNYTHEKCTWQLSEKMTLGALELESDNFEFWVVLGCLSECNALKQHALIRGLQLDVSLATAWAHLGKLYREENEKKLARQAFDYARGIDPSLALPWAGMSADTHTGESAPDDAFESCLHAVKILPLAEFQIGLAKLAFLSGNLSSSQVFGAIQLAVQRAPYCHESHNLNGLVREACFHFQSAIASYRLARYAINISSSTALKSHMKDISTNLARALIKAGNALGAIQECEDLEKEGMLDAEGLQIYAFSLWQLGQNESALSVTRTLAASVSTMDRSCAAVSVSFICRLLYYISGQDLAIVSILKMPTELFKSSKISFIVSAINALDQQNRLESIVSSSRYFLASHEEITGMHYLIALSKLIKHGTEHHLGFQSGVTHLRKALHMYPNSTLIRNLLGYLLLGSEVWGNTHISSRCSIIDSSDSKNKEGLKLAWEIFGAGAVSCDAIGNGEPRFSFPTCGCQCPTGSGALQELQKMSLFYSSLCVEYIMQFLNLVHDIFLSSTLSKSTCITFLQKGGHKSMRREPWNRNGRYLLVLNLLQKARKERFPANLCFVLQRLIVIALSDEFFSGEEDSCQYQKFQLYLCASEIFLQRGNIIGCINRAKDACAVLLPDSYQFFVHLLLCRAYAAQGNLKYAKEEYEKCLELKTDFNVGWMCLKIIESQYELQTVSNIVELAIKEGSKGSNNSWNIWIAVYSLVMGMICIWNQDFLSAEQLLEQSCSLAGAESCILLCHGVASMEIARSCHDSHFLWSAIKSLRKAHMTSSVPVPIASALLAQAEGSVGSSKQWERNLRLEWFSWQPEMRPAELFFQMHLLARQIESESNSSSRVECCQSPQQWVLRAIHTNPSSFRYWKVLPKLL